jgi:Transposase DDE domain
MCKNHIGTRPQNSEAICGPLQQVTFNAVRNVMTDRLIEQSCEEIGYHFRHRKITPVVSVLHMVMAALWPEDSFNACWQVLWDTFISWFPDLKGQCPSRGRVAEARKRLPLALWQRLFEKLSSQAQTLSKGHDTWKGHRVVLVDGTCVSMSETAPLCQAFGVNTGYHGRGRYPLARLVTLCLAGTRTIIDSAVAGYRTGESTLTFPMLASLRKGDLLLADRHFAAAHFYVYYQSLGLEFLTRAHQRLKISRVKRHLCYSADDFIGRLKVNKLYRRRAAHLPAHLSVRFVRARLRIRGTQKDVWFVTSLLDAASYPARDIVALYTQRWRIETLLREVKVTLAADVLRSQTPDGIRKEILARLVALNVVRSIMLEASARTDANPRRISFVHAVRAIISFSPALARAPVFLLPHIYQAMLTEIASHVVPCRPGRREPRAIRRDRKHYPALKVTRAQWRQQNVA